MPDNGPMPPANRPAGTIQDLQAHFAEITATVPVDESSRAAFIQSKLLLAHTHPSLNIASRNAAVKSLVDRLGSSSQGVLSQLVQPNPQETTAPVPGGVGYGFFYTDPGFKTAWGNGTSITFDIVCPTPPGGNVNTFLYLTATNRSGKGVEAFISYNGQNDTHFKVFDWARTPNWQTDIPLAGLTDYLRTDSAHGQNYQVLPVWNGTWLVQGTTWRNQVLLYNHVRNGWDLVYQFDYSATMNDQKTGWVGSWGPIVETFQPLYQQTSPMGALTTQLINADNTGAWGNWAQLTDAQSNVRTDNVGFQKVFLDPNYALVVNS